MKQNDIRLVLLLACLAAAWVLRAQPGGWVVNSGNFQFSMGMVARIETGGAPNQALDNHVAAFSGDQIRGYATPIEVNGQALYFLNLYSNTYLNDSLYFLAFIGAENRVYESTDTVVFLHNALIGTFQNPIVLHFTLSPRPLIYSLANVNYLESNCAPGPLLDIQASDDQDSEGNGLKYHIVGGADSSRFQLDSLTGVLNWKNFVPDFENPQDADANNSYLVTVRVKDLGGNSSVQTITVFVKDDPIPTAGCPPSLVANTSDDGAGNCSTTVSGTLSVTIPTGCAAYPVSYVLEGATTGTGNGQLPASQVFEAGKTTVRYTVTDESGTLSSACSFTVTVTDNEDPQLDCPDNIAVDTEPDTCIAVPGGTELVVTDNCNDLLVKFALSGATKGTGAGQLPADQAFLPGVTTVTYSVSEYNRPAQTCSFIVTVTDNKPPAVSCPDSIGVVLSSGCTSVQSATGAMVSDNCTGIQLNYALSGATNGSGTGQVPGGIKFQAGLTTVVYTVTDGSGQSSCSFVVMVREKQKPEITCPQNTTLTVTGNCEAELPDYLATAQVSDNCTPDTALVLEQSPLAGMLLQGNTMTTVQLTATDLSGNSKSCTFKVTVADLDAVQITCPPNQKVCDGVLGDYVSLATVQTGCTSSGTPSVMQTPAPNSTIPAYNGQTTVTLTATDGPSSSSCVFTVRWQDTEPPQAHCKNAAVPLQAGGQVTVAAADVNDNSTDNCGIQSLMLSNPSFDCDDLPTQTLTLTVTDVHGMTSTCTATVTLSDPSGYCCAAPQAACKTNPTLALGSNGQASITVAAIDNGSTYECGLQSISVQPTAVQCSNIGTPVPVTLTVVDLVSRTSTCMTTLTVQDTTKPVVTCPANQTVYADANCSGTVGTWAAVSKQDNCTASASIGLVQAPVSGTLLSGHNDTRTVTLTATDGAGNTATCSFSVALQDTVAPTLVCKNATVNLVEAPFVGSQAIVATADVFASGSDNCGNISLNVAPNTFTCSHLGNNTVTLTATDQQGLTKTCQATVLVKDMIVPKITCPAGQIIVANSSCTGLVGDWLPVSKSDNCTPSASVSVAQLPAASTALNGHNDSRTVTLTATDASGNTADCTFSVTLKDNSAPSVTCKNATVPLDNASTGSISTASVFQSGSDNCGTVNLVSVTPSTFACSQLGTVTVTLLVNDGNGNTKTCQAIVTVQDTQKPVFTNVPANVTVQCNAIPGPGTATATDNCSVTVVYNGQTLTAGPCPDAYILTRQWTATDGSGNTQTATQRVMVQDTQAPVFTSTPAAITVQCNSIPTVGTATATDNCDAQVTITYDGQTTTAGACPDSYVLTRKWTATDNCGNTKTATQRITVQDTQLPAFTSVPAPVTVECSSLPAVGTPVATDNCDTQVSIAYNGQTTTVGSCTDTYVLTRKWTAMDNCGNTRTATQRITVRDQTKPVFTSVPASISIECSTPPPSPGTVLATDNCDQSVTITYLGESSTSTNCAGAYLLHRTWLATDNCGNSTATTQTITVQDTQAPVFTSVPANMTMECSDLFPLIGPATATDGCGGFVQVLFLGETRTDGDCLYDYTLTRSWRAVDECGNMATASQLITVQDTEAPVFNNPPAGQMATCGNIPSVPPLTAQDNCGSATVTYQGQTQSPGDCNSGYTITRTWLAVDLCGNQQSNTQVIVVMPQLLTGPSGPGSVAVEKIDPVPPSVTRPHVAEEHFRLTPNPAREEVLLSFVSEKAGQTVLDLFDTGGRMVKQQGFDLVAGPNYLYLDVRELAAGWYVVHVRREGLPTKALKLAIERK